MGLESLAAPAHAREFRFATRGEEPVTRRVVAPHPVVREQELRSFSHGRKARKLSARSLVAPAPGRGVLGRQQQVPEVLAISDVVQR